MSSSEASYEPMQVDPEENDNEEVEIRVQPESGGPSNGFAAGAGGSGGGGGAVPGLMAGFLASAAVPSFAGVGGFQNLTTGHRGDIHGEDLSVYYNVENPSIDLETFAQGTESKLELVMLAAAHGFKFIRSHPGYTGLARLYRLRFIAHHCPVLRVEALKLAIQFVQQTHNTMLCAELVKKLALASPASVVRS